MDSARSPAQGHLRVLQVTPRYAPCMGGVETHVREIARRLPARNVDTAVLTTDPTGTLPAHEVLDGVEVDRVRAHPRGRDYMFAPGLYHRIRRGDWDLVHVQSYHTLVAPIAMAAAARARIPYVMTFHAGGHSSRFRIRARQRQLKALRPLLMRAAALVAIAEFEIEHYARTVGLRRGKFVLIPNGADLPEPEDAGSVASHEQTLIVSVGRLERYKGHHRAIAALPHLVADVPDVRLWIAGRGPYGRQLAHLAQQLGLADRVEIGAEDDRRAMAMRLSRASLAVLFSEWETQPIGVLEAASLGVPLLVADNSGLAELTRRGLSRSVALDAPPERHAAAMLQQLRDPLVPHDVAVSTWDACADALAGLYQRAGRSRRNR
jgi:glycosyltransferase involved in cell wall biosynthesis